MGFTVTGLWPVLPGEKGHELFLKGIKEIEGDQDKPLVVDVGNPEGVKKVVLKTSPLGSERSEK